MNTSVKLYGASRLLLFVGLLGLLGGNASAQFSNYSFSGSTYDAEANSQDHFSNSTGNDSDSTFYYDNSGNLVASAMASDSSTFSSDSFSGSLSLQLTNTGIAPEHSDQAYVWNSVQFDITGGYYSYSESYSVDPGTGYAVRGFSGYNTALSYTPLGMIVLYDPWPDPSYTEIPASATFGWSGYLNTGRILITYGMLLQDGNLSNFSASSGTATDSVFFEPAEVTPEPSGIIAGLCGGALLLMHRRVRARRLASRG